MNEINDLFPAGPVLDEGQQVGRGPFLDALQARMDAAEKIKLFASRRTGKTSAATAVIARIDDQRRPVANVDLSRVPASADVARRLAEQLAPGLARADKARRATGWLAELLNSDDGAEERIVGDIAAHLAGDVLQPGKVLERGVEALAGQEGAVVLDEAHLIAAWQPDAQRSLREFLRNDTKLGVIVASSEARALEQLTQAGGPLEFVGTRVPLPAIAREDWEAELPGRFAAMGAPVETDALEMLLDESRCHPYCTMLLARESVRVGLTHSAVTVATVYAGLATAQEDEAWRLRDS